MTFFSNATMHEEASDKNVLKEVKNHLLGSEFPYHFPGLTVDITNHSFNEEESLFFQFIPQTSNIFDIAIGRVIGENPHSNSLIAAAIKYNLIRFAKPFLVNYQYNKMQLWENNLFPPHEILTNLKEDLIGLLADINFSVPLFYGRLNLENNSILFVNSGFNQFYHYNTKESQSVLLEGYKNPIHPGTESALQSSQVFLEKNDYLVFHLENCDPLNLAEHKKYIEILEILRENSRLSVSELINYIKTNSKYYSEKEENSKILILKVNDQTIEPSFKHKKGTFASSLLQLEALRMFIRQICQMTPGNSEKMSIQMQLVVNEIFCNIVKHSYQNDPKKEIVIESKLTPHGLYLTVSDKGTSFDPTEINFPNLAGEQDQGFGFFIIQQLIDQISYIPKALSNGWNHFCIYKNFFFGEDQMELSHVVKGKILVITPQGENLDARNSSQFKDNVLELIRSTGLSQIIFDLGRLQFIDSSGLGAFLSLQRTLNAQGGVLKLCQLNKAIKTMFEIVSMHRIFDIFNTIDEAIKSF